MQTQDKMDNYLAQRKDFEGLNDTRMFTDHQLDSLTTVAGFADRNWALGQLGYNDDGSRNLDNFLAETFISWLFILFECLPVFVKLMSPRGPYDVAVGKLAEANIHAAERDKEREIEVTDNVYDHTREEDVS